MAKRGLVLRQTSLLLGGAVPRCRCFALLAIGAKNRAMLRHHVRDLIETQRLLALQLFGDPDREETAIFANLDPADPPCTTGA